MVETKPGPPKAGSSLTARFIYEFPFGPNQIVGIKGSCGVQGRVVALLVSAAGGRSAQVRYWDVARGNVEEWISCDDLETVHDAEGYPLGVPRKTEARPPNEVHPVDADAGDGKTTEDGPAVAPTSPGLTVGRGPEVPPSPPVEERNKAATGPPIAGLEYLEPPDGQLAEGQENLARVEKDLDAETTVRKPDGGPIPVVHTPTPVSDTAT